MIYNNKNIEIEKIKAFHIIKKNSREDYIEVLGKDGLRIDFCFNNEGFDPRKMSKNKKINIIKYLYWDVTLTTKDTFYLFDLTKEQVYLTRLDDNQYELDVHIENPDMIFSPSQEHPTFDNLIVKETLNFIYEESNTK